MKKNFANIFKLLYIFVPFVVFVLMFSPIVKVRTKLDSTIGDETVSTTSTQTISAFGLIGGIFVSDNYDGGNDTLKTLSKVKAIGNQKDAHGFRTVVLNGLFSLFLLIATVALMANNFIQVLDLKNKKFNRFKNVAKKINPLFEFAFGSSALFIFIFSFMLTTWRYSFNILGAKLHYATSSHIVTAGIFVFVLAFGYLASKIILTQKGFFEEEQKLPEQTEAFPEQFFPDPPTKLD